MTSTKQSRVRRSSTEYLTRAGKIKLIESVESAMAGFEGSMKDPGILRAAGTPRE